MFLHLPSVIQTVVTTLPSTKIFIQKEFSRAAKNNNIYILVGISQHEDKNSYNAAWLFKPDGTLGIQYYKQHLVPGLETSRYVIGKQIAIMNLPYGKMGIAICHDLDFLSVTREYGKNKINFMLAPALDFPIMRGAMTIAGCVKED